MSPVATQDSVSQGSIRLHRIGVHPVKSCRAVHPEAWRVEATGLELDRAWMLVDPDGRFISQREEPAMATIQTTIETDAVIVRDRDGHVARIPLSHDPDAPVREVRLHQADRLGIDFGDAVADWFTAALQRPCRLVQAIPARDPWENHEPEGERAKTRFPDLYPILVASEASLQALFPGGEFGMDRFRPNLTISGAPAFAEDQWKRIQIGDVVLELVKPCARCQVTTVDQSTGVRQGPQPLQDLAKSRSWHRKPVFGWNALVRSTGEIRLGDRVKVLDLKLEPTEIGPSVRE